MLMQELEIEVAQGRRFLEDGVHLVPVTSARHYGGEVVAGVIRGVSKITSDHHRGVIQQGPLTLLDLIEF